MAEWQPIETTPKDYTEVWVDLGPAYRYRFRAARYDRRLDRWIEKVSDIIDTPTHWMPLPEPPKEIPDV